MDFFGIVSLFGGLALFLYGMNVMGDGLTKTAGGKLEVLLEKLSASPMRGMLLGMAVTAVIQSSSATTVMVVGFVNSGIMKLSQATGIILGANFGATITPWILSLSGISGGSFFVQLVKPSTFAPILGVIGVVLYIFIKEQKKRNVGSIMLGFFVLMTGMSMMSAAVKPLAESPEFERILITFSNPIVGMLVGTFVTAVIQSSAASIGILQALSISGSVTFGTAIPIITGQNIGTCISALLSSIGARTNARRAAFIHLYFNVLKVVIFLIVFYGINSVVHFEFLNNIISPVYIAIIHSLLNAVSVLVFMPFSKYLQKLAEITIREKIDPDEEAFGKYKEELKMLDERFLNIPDVAVETTLSVTRRMAELTANSLMAALSMINEYSEEKFNKVDKLENVVDVYEDRVGTYIVKLSQRTLSISDSNKLSIILHSISNFERISDHAESIAVITKRMHESGEKFTPDCIKELSVYCDAVREIVINTTEVFQTFDVGLAKRVEPLEEVIDNINEKAKRHHIKRMRAGECTVDLGVHFDNVVNDLERVSDHCSNIAVTIIEINENVYETHEYLDTIKHAQSEEFQRMYHEYDEKFHI